MASMTLSGCILALWFDEGQGAIAYDSSGQGNNGTLNGSPLPSWVAGKYATGLNFVHTLSQYVSMSRITLTGAYTVGLWLNRINNTNTDFFLGDNSFDSKMGSITADNHLWIRPYASAGVVDDNVLLPVGQLFYLAVTRDINGVMYAYVNGVQNSLFSGAAQLGTAYFNLVGNDNSSNYYDGLIDEVQIYNRALSQTEIRTIMNQLLNTQINATFQPFTGAKPPGNVNVNWTLQG